MFQVFHLFWVNFSELLGSSFNLLHVNIQFSQHNLLKRLLFPHCVFLLPLPKISCPYIHGFISGLFVLFHWSCACFFYDKPIAILIAIALLYSLKLGNIMPPALLFKSALAIWNLSWSNTNFKIVWYIFVRKCPWDSDRDFLKSVDCFM